MAYFDQPGNQAKRPTLHRNARSAYTAPEVSFAPALRQPSSRIPRVPVPQHPAKGMWGPHRVAALDLPKNEHHIHGTEACLLTKMNAHTPLASLLDFTTMPEIVADIKPVTPVTAFAQNENIDTSAHMPDKPLSLPEDEYGNFFQRTYTAAAPSASKTVFRPSPLRNALQLSDMDGEDKVQPWARPTASPSPPCPPQKDARSSSRFRTQHESSPGNVDGKKHEQQDSGKGDAFREDPSDHSQACASSVASQYQNQAALMAICKTSLTASERARWIVSADIDLLTRAKAVDRLRAAREEQEKLRLKYADLQIRRDRDSTDSATLVPWYRLVTLIGELHGFMDSIALYLADTVESRDAETEHKMIDEGRFEYAYSRIIQMERQVLL